MNPCELLETCPFFTEKLGALPGLTKMLKEQYCLFVKTRCARYRVVQAVGRQHVPSDLYPNDAKRAESIILEVRNSQKDQVV
ncbi:MAG: hypothetical protein JW849_06015 [Phycisphaerae bacterium]|nr:hypothetical protein [Phycisphaerae bacterium]